MQRRQEPKRVLIVEDDALLAMALEAAFRDAGRIDVATAARADVALEKLSGRAPHILVLDLSLDDSDEGFGIAEIALQLFNPPPRIVFSTGSPERIPRRLARIGRVFSKPYDPVNLAQETLANA